MASVLKTKNIPILAILAGMTYAFLIFNSFSSDWDSWKMSFNEKTLGAEYNKWGDIIGYKPTESYSLSVRPKNGFASFPDSLVNLKTNQCIKTKYKEMIVLGSPSKLAPTSMGSKVLLTFLAILLLVVSIRIPIHFYKIIGLFKKEFIFERKSIWLLRWLGLELLIIYFGGVFAMYMFQQIDRSLFSFSDYELVTDSMDAIWLLLGIVVLLVSEILSKAMVLKEEQELTI